MTCEYKLVSFDVCPYVQRSIITLEEKQVSYDIEYIELGDPPDWFLTASPLGKVPILFVAGAVLFESAVINEYLDEVTPGRRLHPEEPLQRARDRAWIEFTSTILIDRNRMQHAATEEETRTRAAELREKLARLEGELGSGPLFHDEMFSLVDAAAAPLFQRLDWLLELAPDLGVLEDLPKVAAWSQALLARESIRRSTVPNIRERYFDYLQGKRGRNPDGTPSWLGRLAVSGGHGS